MNALNRGGGANKRKVRCDMDDKRKTVLAGMLALCIIFVAAFAGGGPVAASPMPKEKDNTGWITGGPDGEVLDKTLSGAYAGCGIERKGGSYYYKGKRVKVIKDQSPDGSVYRFDPHLKGSVSIKVVRNAKGKVKRISYLSRKKAANLIKRAGLNDGKSNPGK